MIVPINVATVTQAVLEQLQADPRLTGVTVERSTEVPNGETQDGWVGIYRARIQYPARTLGHSVGYRQQRIGLVIMLQQSVYTSGADCEDLLEALAQKVIGALLSDESFKGTVDTLDEFDVNYSDYDKREGGYYVQRAIINLTGVVNVSAM